MQLRTPVSLLFAAALLVCEGLRAQTPVWTQMPGAPSGTTPRFDDISFVNEFTGYVARATGGIFKTTDGGNTFTLSRSSTVAYPGTNLTAHFRSICFASATHGWAGNLGPGSYDSAVNDTNILFETFDGGLTWTNKPGFPETGMKGLCAMYALDSQHIYGGGRVRGPAYFIKSTDGGTNWSVTNLTAAGILGGIMDVYFRDANNGFLVGMDTNAFNSCSAPYYHGAIARTTNGGVSWEVVAASGLNCAYFWKMAWPSANVGYATLQQNSMSSTGNHIVYKTIDGGATWTSNGVPFSVIGVNTFYSQGIAFINDNEGWIGGDSASGLNNFLHTTDGGDSWTRVGSDTTLRINRVRFLRPDYAVASGARVAAYRLPLTILSSPTNLTVSVSSSAAFYSAAIGGTTPTYQWRHGGTNIGGATGSSYVIPNATAADAGSYDVVVTDVSGPLTSGAATLTVTGVAIPPSITTQPQSLVVSAGSNATFTVSATGTAPLKYQWRFNNSAITSATNTIYTRTNVQTIDLGNYSVVVTNSAGGITSALASVSFGFSDNFDSYGTPSLVTAAGTTNGYKIVYRTAAGPVDFKAIFGFDYSTVTYPTNIPSAPHSVGGTTKGLYLTVNKDATAGAAAVNLYPTGLVASGNFALKFDLWINWSDPLTSTEHTLFGINHTGTITNRIGQSPSDGLFFAIEGEADSPANSTTLRDYSVFRGNGLSAAVLMTTNNTVFGPTPPLGSQFDTSDPGFVALFPARNIPSYGAVPAGTAGLRWLSGEVRQVNGLITCLLNGTAIAQYTNTTIYTNGTLMLGYNDNFNSIGNSDTFAIFDNIRVEGIVLSPVTLLSSQVVGNNFKFSFATEAYESYTVQWTTNLTTPNWVNYTNFAGNGVTNDMQVPLDPAVPKYFRVSRP